MVVAMVPVRVVQVTVDQVVDVVSMRNGLMAASRSVLVPGLMPAALMLRRTPIGICRRHLDRVLIDVVAVHVMQVPVVQIIDMIAVAHRGVPASGTMLMRVIGVMGFLARRHAGLHFSIVSKIWCFGIAGYAQLSRHLARDLLKFSFTDRGDEPHQLPWRSSDQLNGTGIEFNAVRARCSRGSVRAARASSARRRT